MGKILKIINDYKNALYVFMLCIGITMSGLIFSKGDFYNYNYERDVVQDCSMGWYDLSDKKCENLKERQRVLDDEDINNAGKVIIPKKVTFDYIMFLSNTLQIIFVGIYGFILGSSTKQEKLSQLWKFIDVFFLLTLLTVILNFGTVLVNGVFGSNDFLRFLFEMGVSIIVIILGRKL